MLRLEVKKGSPDVLGVINLCAFYPNIQITVCGDRGTRTHARSANYMQPSHHQDGLRQGHFRGTLPRAPCPQKARTPGGGDGDPEQAPTVLSKR